MIVPYPIFPPDEGGRVRAYQLLKHLAASHEVILLSPRLAAGASNDLPLTLYETTPPGRRRQIFSPGFLVRAWRIVRRERPDMVVSEYPWPGIHSWLLASASRRPFFLDAPNLEGERFRSTGARYWRLVAFYERLVMRLARRVFVVSEADRATLVGRGLAPANVEVVPNGVDPAVSRPDVEAGERVRRELGIGADTRLFLFFGQLDYAPNRQALAALTREILPRLDRRGLDYQLVVAGKGDVAGLTARYAHQRLRFVGRVEAIAPYINAADAVLVPIVSGGGTRLKILESIACGVPVVSTSIGAEGIDGAVCGGRLVLADDWDAFASALVDLALDSRVTRSAPADFLDVYAWANIVQRVTCLSGPRAGSVAGPPRAMQ